MIEKDMSPEERLLALIKKKDKDKPADRAINRDETKAPVGEAQETRAASPRASDAFKLAIFKKFDPAVLRSINKYLAPLLTMLIGYLFVDLFFIKSNFNTQSLISKSANSKGDLRRIEDEVPSKAKDYSHYSEIISSKRLFGPPLQEEARPQEPTKSEEEISKALSLVGIIAGEEPQAIIEDKKNQKTYYLNRGQSFDGFTVEEVSSGKVTLNYRGKKVMLIL